MFFIVAIMIAVICLRLFVIGARHYNYEASPVAWMISEQTALIVTLCIFSLALLEH